MSNFVVDTSVVLHWLREYQDLPTRHRVLAPTLLRSQVLDSLYREVQDGALSEAEGLDRLARFARMKIRYLGDKVLRRKACEVAKRLGFTSTHDAEYLALTVLQADAFVTLDASLAQEARAVVPTATLEDLR